MARIDRLASQGNLGALAAMVAAEHQAVLAMHHGAMRGAGQHPDEDDDDDECTSDPGHQG
jgi:hypothetical protein